VTGDPPYRVVVIGAGFAGTGMGVALRQAGISDFLIVDKAGDLGGTWRDNTYPGLCCDVPCNLRWLTVRPEVQAQFNAWVRSASATSVWETGCHNWYTTASGRNTSNWPVHTFIYRHRVRRFDLSQYTVMPEHVPAPAPVAGAR